MSMNILAEAREEEFLARDRTRLFYRRWQVSGITPRRLVILVHGFADHSGRYADLVQDLCAHGAVVYGYDQRGQGLSQGQRGHVMAASELLDDLADFIDLAEAREPGLERVLYGHSTGAIFTLQYAYAHPDRVDRLVLSSACLLLGIKAPAWKTAVGRALAGVWPRLTMKAGFNPDGLTRDPEAVRRNLDDPLVSQAISTRYYREVYLVAMPEALARIEQLRVPFVLVHGADDHIVSPVVAEEFARRARVAHQIHVYPGARHETFNEINRDEVFADIEAWLDRPLGATEH
ncbi:MAG: alpha/beta hydrolase [Candidatus Dormibacteria bacterium]